MTKKRDEMLQTLHITVVAIVALVAIVGVTAIILNGQARHAVVGEDAATGQVTAGPQAPAPATSAAAAASTPVQPQAQR